MAGKIEIPEQLKNELPPSKWGKILAATPIVMTVLATMLAGLASSEMTKAQYDRSLAELLDQKVKGDPFRALFGGQVPDPVVTKLVPEVQAALDAVEKHQSDAEINAALAKVSLDQLAAALATAQQDALAYDKVIKAIDRTINIELKPLFLSFYKEKLRAFNAAGFRYRAARYDTEAALNATVANLLELQVKKQNFSARHHRRSGKFFYGMLAAQMGVIIATFSIAARQRSFLWSLAAAAGLVAVSFSLYVYLYV